MRIQLRKFGRKCCEKILRENHAGNLVGNVVGNLVGKTCGKILWEILQDRVEGKKPI